MLNQAPERDHARFLRLVHTLLLIILLIKVSGFFTWSENIGITRVFKVASRISMTAAAYAMYRMIVRRGAVDSFHWDNAFSPVLYLAYLFLGLVSMLWSTNPGYSLLQWIMDVESLVFAFYFVKSFILIDTFFLGGNIRFYHVMGNACFLIMLIFLVGMWVAPDVFYRLTHGGEEARLGGFMMNPNELGMLCVACISCFIFDLYRGHRKVWTMVKILLVLYALVMTGSRSSLIGFLLVVFFHIRQSDSIKLKLAVNLGAVLAIPVIVQTIFIKQGDLEEVMSMTGRLPFWTALITEGLPKEPLLGFGFMRIAYREYFQSVHTYAGQMTHNTFIQVLMNLGFVGLGIVLLQLIFTLRGFLRHPEKEKRLMFVGILIPIMINSFTEFGIFGETNYGILFYQLLIFSISMRYNPLLTAPERLYLKRL